MNLPLKPLGSTDVILSPLSLGTVKIGRNQSVKYPTQFDLPSDQDILTLLHNSLDIGISTLDTAPAYGIAEQRLGKFIKNNRQHVQIISKAGEQYQPESDNSEYFFDAKFLKQQLENSLRNLQTDYLDCWLLHCNNDDLANLTDEAITCLQQAKKDGWVRSIGASTKTVAAGEKALDHFDCIMMTSNLEYSDEDSLFDYAKSVDKGILLKKIFNSGWALQQQNPQAKQETLAATYQQLFKHSSACSAVIGTINPKHLIENAKAFIEACL